MRLGISSAVAPGFSLDELARSCRHRGLRALELVDGHAHGVSLATTPAQARDVRAVLQDAGVEHLVFRPAEAAAALTGHAVGLARDLGADVAVAGGEALGDAVRLEAAAALHAAAGTRLLLLHGTEPGEAEACRDFATRAAAGGVVLGWTADPGAGNLATAGAAVLEAAGAYLDVVRLAGSGPESAASEGKGVGALMARLALRGYAGALLLTPTSPSTLPVWRVWLGRASGWGCGSRTADATLVNLEARLDPAQETA